ncbi:MAG: RNA-binding protein [Desulfurococcales archaeon ex4484_58]|nr:MAG: RNA-binding protein [Desulfurococcales archaeon ex4484_58]
MVRVRVRGITATAVSKILLDKGYSIVQASDIIRKRFDLETDNSPADVTIKDSSEDELLVLGFFNDGKKVFDDLVDSLEYVFEWVSPIGLYSIHVGIVKEKILDKCIVELGNNIEGILFNCRHNTGDKIVVSIDKAPVKPGEKPRLSYRLRVVGEYVSLIYGSSTLSISEHIRDRSKREYLLAIATAKLIGSGLGIHFRSSSMYGSREDIEREIDELKRKLMEIIDRAKNIDDPPQTIYEGEFIGLIGLTSLAKEKLDLYRGEVVSTMPRHHSFKSCSGVLSELVDFIEQLISVNNSLKDFLVNAIDRYIAEKLLVMPRVRIIHKKPDGSVHELTPGYIRSVEKRDYGLEVILTRTIRSNGMYDGLNVEKKEGDIDYMVVRSNEWFISHNYYRRDEWIGTYININTPPEILPGLIKYHDLLVDIIIKPGNEPEIIDLEEFDKYCEENIISEKLCNSTREKIDEVINNVEKYIYRPS